MMGAPRKRAHLEERAASEPLVSLEAIFRLGKETQRCVVEGEATFNAGHIVLWYNAVYGYGCPCSGVLSPDKCSERPTAHGEDRRVQGTLLHKGELMYCNS